MRNDPPFDPDQDAPPMAQRIAQLLAECRRLELENTSLIGVLRSLPMQLADAKGSRSPYERNRKLNAIMEECRILAGPSRSERRERAEKSGCGCMDSDCDTCFPKSDNATFSEPVKR